MTRDVKVFFHRLKERKYCKHRQKNSINVEDLQGNSSISLAERVGTRLHRMVLAEKPLVYKNDRIGFYRTIKVVPAIISEKEREELSKDYLLFDGAIIGNISSDYEEILNVGFDRKIEEIKGELKVAKNKNEVIELTQMLNSIYDTYLLVDKYKVEAKIKNNVGMVDILNNIPRKAPSSFHEALVFLRILNYMLWLNGNKHNTIGRFDQYMFKFYSNDIEKNIITIAEAKDLLEEFFISLNYDSDLYPGIQQGDNGQSLVLGGVKRNGENGFNSLSKLCLEASLDLELIDPKINLRVDKNTDSSWFKLGTKLTKQGLGFPQYSNDDVVIPALTKLGYALEDARDYVVAACWEFIIPGYGMDIPNIDALNFPLLVQNVVKSQRFLTFLDYNAFAKAVNEEIEKDVKRMVDLSKNDFLIPSPFQSILMKNCVTKHKDLCDSAKYNNYGFHGTGLASAADAMAAIKDHIFIKKDMSKSELVNALNNNFEGFTSIQHLLTESPKMGNNDDFVDNIGVSLLDKFSLECSKYKNNKGGIYRAGTGSAMYYIWFSQNLGATADGRKSGDPFSANFSPSLNHHFNGVLSVVQSFTKPHLINACNGGPLTLEFHDTLFRSQEGMDKVAMLVKTFIDLGGHQLQLNAINRDTLLDAQKHPEDHKNLIVRVWGWSGYFNELDLVYQEHIIKRLEFNN